MKIIKYKLIPFWKGTEVAPDNYVLIKKIKIFGVVLFYLSKIKE
jgi:hypothetical protein